MKSPILRRYKRAVFYTYVAVVILALITVRADYGYKLKPLLNHKEALVSQYARQVNLLLESNLLVLQSLSDFISDELNQAPLNSDHLEWQWQQYQQEANQLLAQQALRQDPQQMGYTHMQGMDAALRDSFFAEWNMTQRLSMALPMAARMLPTAEQIYYLSARHMAVGYPWAGDPEFSYERLLGLPLLRLAQPKSNPERKRFWSQGFHGEDGSMIATIGMPVYLHDQFLGAIFVDLNLQQLGLQIEQYFESDSLVMVIDSDQQLLMHSKREYAPFFAGTSLSQKLPPELRTEPLSLLIKSNHGRLINDYYVRSESLQNAPWQVLFMQSQASLTADIVLGLESTFWILLIALSLLISMVHLFVFRTFVRPAMLLLKHLERSTESLQALPHSIDAGWRPWFELVHRTFEQNQQYTHHLSEQNRRLDKLVAQRTERLRLANEQRERDFSLMRSLIDAIPEAIVFKDTAGRYLGCNKAAEDLLGQTESELIGCNLLDVDDSPDAARRMQEEQSVLQKRTPQRFQEHWSVEGKLLQLDVLRLPFYSRRGELLGLISVWRDVTRDKQQQERLQLSERRYHMAMDAVEDGMWDWYLDSNHIICNPAYYTMLGYQADEFPLLMETFYKLMHDDDRQRVERYAEDYTEHGQEAYNIEFRLLGKDGAYRWILSRGRGVEFDAQGRLLRILGTHKDITRQKENEVTLLEAKQDAELANRTKSEFLANMSHEIRTPMNAVLGMLELTLRTNVDARQLDYLDKAKTSATSLLRIINDILDFSKIEAGKLELEQRSFSLEKVLDEALAMASVGLQNKPVELLLFAPISSGLYIHGDSLRLGQILTNLLSNAVKFTHQGEIELGCEDVEDVDDRITLKFWVRDTGIGISPAQQRKLFDPFSQADGSTTREYGGSGLGLSICKHLVSLMGGDIKLSSALEKGTTFSFTIDAVKSEAPLVTATTALNTIPNPMAGLTALVVDDNPAALAIYGRQLTALGFKTIRASSAEEALFQLSHHQPALVLLDWQIGDMDGLQLVDEISQLHLAGDLDNYPEIIMMTAQNQEELAPDLRPQTIKAILPKPFSQTVLQDTVLNAFATPFEASATLVPEAAPTVVEEPQAMHILLVEDNLINQQVASELLKSAGYQVTVAENGQVAVDNVAHQAFDLVLMDIQMPVMDGLTAARCIRKTHPDLPIVAMTAHAMSGDREKSLAAGMNDHITKPIVLPQLFDVLATYLGNAVTSP